jgi:hypothetical protein
VAFRVVPYIRKMSLVLKNSLFVLFTP